MKKSSIVLICLLSIGGLKAQDFQGKVEYLSKIISKILANEAAKSEREAQIDKEFQAAYKKASEKKYELTFNKNECLFEEIQELEKPEGSNGEFNVSIKFSGGGKKYMNLKDKTKIEEDEIFDKEFLIVDKLEDNNWRLINETKKIGDYTCYKAEVIIPISQKQREEYAEYLKRSEKKKDLFPRDEPKDEVVTAWYTPEIPVSFGPANYHGLPGLILELNLRKQIILCSKVTLSQKSNMVIKVPNIGKRVTRIEFDKIEKDKNDSMKGNIMFTSGE